MSVRLTFSSENRPMTQPAGRPFEVGYQFTNTGTEPSTPFTVWIVCDDLKIRKSEYYPTLGPWSAGHVGVPVNSAPPGRYVFTASFDVEPNTIKEQVVTIVG